MSTSLQLLLLVPFGAGLIVGAGNYLLVRLAYDHVPDFVEGVSFPCALLLFLVVLPLMMLVCPPLLLLLPPIGILAARADRAVSTEDDTTMWHFWRLCVAVVVSLVDAFAISLFVSLFAGRTPLLPKIDLAPDWISMGLIGFMVGPVLAPLWIWGYRKASVYFERLSPRSEGVERERV